ncbi:NUDIX domain-containing protein [Buchnera aphidicola (Aphis helianthi)]|uniref:8-oxo-dGTP diphosphatase n=1 Tax=Buchnera aphidicola (Aphis helianthi) TaxID=2315802 RepID=A0A4D6XKK8_9GAMM|nr:NUDIX domain-containing protein [Buchnera aphidicola]QCI17033.1 NUDIX domain-containing protein [Buchnera aphidicola (Aphis helianthi)]
MNYIKIAIGIILKKNKVYITKANKIKYKTNVWEFPGGKVKKNENIICALKRELLEEVGISTLNFKFFQYKKIYCKNNKLYFFLINKWIGKVHSKEGYNYKWVHLKKLKFYEFPTANYIIIKNLNTLNINLYFLI